MIESARNFHDPDALKKALIYSKILHRKYEEPRITSKKGVTNEPRRGFI